MDDTAMNTDDRSRAIRHDIAQTREEMAETIDAIQDKLRPAAIVAPGNDFPAPAAPKASKKRS